MKKRLITSLVAGFAFLSVLYLGGIPFLILIGLMTTLAVIELNKMLKIKAISTLNITTVILINGFLFLEVDKMWIIITASLFIMLIYTFKKERYSIEQMAINVLALLYVGIGFYAFKEIRIEEGFIQVLFILILIWTTDSAAYIFGKQFGKKKLAKDISPNKTIEGSLSGVISCMVIALGIQYFFQIKDSYITTLSFAVIVSIFGQIGDLVESKIKRNYDVKDSGNILPGHGGILDRFDSLIFVMPIIFVVGQYL